MDREEIIRKIRKCLALSESANQHEAALALLRAQDMMGKHNISAMDVDLSEISGHRTSVGRAKNPPGHVAILVNMMKKAFGCEAVLTNSRQSFDRWSAEVEFIGFGPNPEIAAYAFDVLLRQMERGRRRYLKTLSKRMKPTNKAKMAANWAEGWVIAVYRKVSEMAVCSKDRELLAQWTARRFGKLETGKSRSAPKAGARGDRAAWEGFNAGDRVRLHRGMGGVEKAMLE